MKAGSPGAWKPDRCHDCGAPHPSFSRNGTEGPWRCAKCDRLAGMTAKRPARDLPPPAPTPDRLL